MIWESANVVKIVCEFLLHETIFCYSERYASSLLVSDLKKIWMHVHSLGISNWIIKRC
jgi:hypothetical protein